MHGYVGVVRVLLDRGANVEIKDTYGKTALERASAIDVSHYSLAHAERLAQCRVLIGARIAFRNALGKIGQVRKEQTHTHTRTH